MSIHTVDWLRLHDCQTSEYSMERMEGDREYMFSPSIFSQQS